MVSSWLLLIDTGSLDLTVDLTLRGLLLSSSSSDSHSIDNVSLLGLIANLSGLFWSGRLADSMDNWELSVFPGSESEDEGHHVRLLLSPQGLKIFVGTHFLSFL